MKFVCLGYIEPGKFENMLEHDRNAMVDRCFTYDDVLRKDGHFAGGEALQPSNSAKTLRFQAGKVIVTDGPYAETEEVLAGYWIVDCAGIDRATEIAAMLTECPGPQAACGVEVRPLLGDVDG